MKEHNLQGVWGGAAVGSHTPESVGNVFAFLFKNHRFGGEEMGL